MHITYTFKLQPSQSLPPIWLISLEQKHRKLDEGFFLFLNGGKYFNILLSSLPWLVFALLSHMLCQYNAAISLTQEFRGIFFSKLWPLKRFKVRIRQNKLGLLLILENIQNRQFVFWIQFCVDYICYKYFPHWVVYIDNFIISFFLQTPKKLKQKNHHATITPNEFLKWCISSNTQSMFNFVCLKSICSLLFKSGFQQSPQLHLI